MRALNWRAFGGLLWLFIALATSLFVPAWTFKYRQAWVFLAVFSASVLAITVYVMQKDPKLLERRVDGGPFAEQEMGQKITQFVASIAFVAVVVLSALDHRFRWFGVEPGVALAGDLLVAGGLLIVFFCLPRRHFCVRDDHGGC
jgi:protein-S-isoprenylcysteine O-methyltransferase Ste14